MPSLRRFVLSVVLVVTLTAADRVKFDTAKREASDNFIETIKGELTKPSGAGPFPAVVILHSCGGLMESMSVQWPRFLAKSGYVVLAVDTFGSRNVGPCPNRLGNSRMDKDAYGALDFLAKQPFVDSSRVALFGYSLGANVINDQVIREEVSWNNEFAAAIAFYGSCDFMIGLERTRVPTMQIFGSRDKLSSTCSIVDDVGNMEIVKLEGAHHAFDNERASGRRDANGHYMEYSRSATLKARQAALDFLSRKMK